MPEPSEIHLIGNEIAIRWSDGSEDYYPMGYLRAESPSAANKGERDLTGQVMIPESAEKKFADVTVTGWDPVGGYAVQFHFSDGHNTGLYTYDYLKAIAPES